MGVPKPIQRLRVRVFVFMNDPSSTLAARIYSIAFLAFIIFSLFCFLLETHPKLVHETRTWRMCEIVSTIVFTLEYVTRLAVCTVPGDETVWQFLRRPMNICDLCAILPFYVQIAIEGGLVKVFLVFRAVRLVRLFKIFKMGSLSGGLQLISEALMHSANSILVLVFCLVIGVVLASSALYYVEKLSCPDSSAMQSEIISSGGATVWENRTVVTAWDRYVSECRASGDGLSEDGTLCCNDDETALDFPSIPHAFWWSVVTMTTVGFGDLYPRTWQGRVVSVISMLAGILLIALPVAIIGRNFQDMSRRLRLMELEPEVSLFALELADLLDESEGAQKYIEQCETANVHRWKLLAGSFERVMDVFNIAKASGEEEAKKALLRLSKIEAFRGGEAPVGEARRQP